MLTLDRSSSSPSPPFPLPSGLVAGVVVEGPATSGLSSRGVRSSSLVFPFARFEVRERVGTRYCGSWTFDAVYRPGMLSEWSRSSGVPSLVSGVSVTTPGPQLLSVSEPLGSYLENPSQRSADGDRLHSTTTHLSRGPETRFRIHLQVLQEL